MSNKQTQATDAPKRKPGPEGNFRGLRLEYLTSHLSAYQKAVKDKTTRDFWQPVFSGYWKRVEWRKLLEEETDSDLFQNASVIADELLSEGDSALKSAAIAKTNQQIKSWFQNRKYQNKPVTSNPYTSWLEQFRKPSGPPPKKPSLAQFYMQHQDYADKVNQQFKARCLVEHTPKSHLLSLRCDVAKELFAEETQEVQAKVKEELDTAHTSLFAKYQEDMTGEPSTDPTDQKMDKIHQFALNSARDLLAEVVQPFIDGIHKYTGLTICLVGGAPPRTPTDRFELFTLHAGKTVGDDPKNWTDWDRPAFKKQILNPFMKFLRHTVENCPSGSAGVDDEEPNIFISSGAGSTVPAAVMRLSANIPSTNAFSAVPSTTISAVTTASTTVTLSDLYNQEQSPSPPSTPPAARPPSISFPIPSMSPLKLGEHLRRHINGLAPQGQKAEIARLTKLSEYERTRENNILQNKELLLGLGIDGLNGVINKAGRNNGLSRGKSSGAASQASAREKDPEDFEPDESEDPSSEHVGPPRRSTRLSAAQPIAMDKSTEVSVGSTSAPNDVLANHGVTAVDQSGSSNMCELQEDEEPNNGLTDHDSTAINQFGSPNMGKSKNDKDEGIDESVGTEAIVILNLAPAVEVDRTEWPAWVDTWYNIFMDKGFGPLWVEAVRNWTAIERGYNWESPKTTALTTKCRPGVVSYWVQRGRPVEPERYPDIGSPSAFATQWWAWWVELNPDRRDMAIAGRLTPGGRVSFDSVKKPGKNGLLSVLVCLMWWRDAIGSGDATDWESAMREVFWVMLEIRGINTRKHLRSNVEGEDQTNKKARVE